MTLEQRLADNNQQRLASSIQWHLDKDHHQLTDDTDTLQTAF